ncbi:HNH endonuclease [Sporomusa sphaeroides]|jgi:5-methylcytosine-specific restriction endonuclease McrA|uniref:HNH endonuclease domain-containing protein n=1 Tax=Sporomusa sphaeroides TaxID=47679 RepID=UPI003DA0186A
MDEYIKIWNYIIMNGGYDNTYKMAWAKAVVELSIAVQDRGQHSVTFTFKQIAEKYLSYYWNQTIYFDLVQGSNLKKIPEIVNSTKALIEQYHLTKRNYLPERFEKVQFERLGLSLAYQDAIGNIVKTLKKDVCYRFLNVGGITYNIYELDRKVGLVTLSADRVRGLAEYSELLLQVINYRWTQMLESFNYSPKIAMKVRAIAEGKIRRNNLSSFHPYLDLAFDNGERICFYCQQPISDEDLSVDHVIPWSYMFSDDLWNLVYSHKTENSSKSNISPLEEVIVRLEQRNKLLKQKLEKSVLKKDKQYDQLNLAIEKDYVRKFWIAAKG